MAVTHPVVTAEPNDPDYDVSATAWNQAHTVADGSFVAAKLSATATDKVFGRSTAGAGNGEEIPLTAFGRSLIDDAAASNARTTLGLVIGTDVPGQAAFDDHSARHETGGADAIKLDDLAAPDDNTDLNASTSKHGLMPKGTGSTTTFYRSDMTQATPAGGSALPNAVAFVATDQGTSSGFPVALATDGPAVTLTVNTKVKVTVSADIYAASGTSTCLMGCAVSGANTIAAAGSAMALILEDSGNGKQASRSHVYTGLTPGSTTFTAKYGKGGSGGAAQFRYREILVECLD